MTSIYAAKPWLGRLTDAQRATVTPPATVVHSFRAAVDHAPDHTALAYFDGRLTYRETDELSDSVAGHLAADGIERGDRVAIMLQNTPHFVLALLGAWKAGTTVVPLNPMCKSAEVAHVLADADVSALICSDRAWEAYLRESAAASPVRIVLTACELDLQTRGDTRVLGFERLPRAHDADDLVTVASGGAACPRRPWKVASRILHWSTPAPAAPFLNTVRNTPCTAARPERSWTRWSPAFAARAATRVMRAVRSRAGRVPATWPC